MEIDELIDKIIERFKNDKYYYDRLKSDMTILSNYSGKNEEKLCRTIIKDELLNFINNLNKDVIEYKIKCEIYETLINSSNFKVAVEKVNKRKEVEKDV